MSVPAKDTLLHDRYRILRELGRGAAGTVLLANDERLGREVAVKLIRGDGPLSEAGRLVEEARAMAAIHHPNVVRVLDFGEIEASVYLVLEYLPAGSLEDLLRDRLPGPSEVNRLALEILEGLAAVHQKGILHRDLKEANVLLSDDGHAQLSDFGLALFDGRKVQTKTGWIVGTPGYMAPEIFSGEKATPASDVYAYGCLLHRLCHGTAARSGTLQEIMAASASGAPPATDRRSSLDSVILWCLAPAPGERPSLEELRESLRKPVKPASGDQGVAFGRAKAEAPAPERRSPLPDTKARPLAATAGKLESEGFRRRAAFAALGLVVASVAALAMSSRRPTPGTDAAAPIPSAVESGLDSEVLADRWIHRVESGELMEAMGKLHRLMTTMESAKSNYQLAIRAHHKDPEWEDRQRVLSIIRAGKKDLPWQRELDQHRGQLLSMVHGPGALSDRKRTELTRALNEVAAADAYFRSWGEPVPYGLLGRLPGALKVEPQSFRVSAAAPLTDGGTLSLGTHSLFALDHPDRKGIFVLSPINRSSLEGGGADGRGNESYWEKLWLSSQKALRIPFHLEKLLAQTLNLPASLAEAPLTLEFDLANVFPPTYLHVSSRRSSVDLHFPTTMATKTGWKLMKSPEWRVEVPLPPGFLEVGQSDVKVQARLPVGVEPVFPISVHGVRLRVGK